MNEIDKFEVESLTSSTPFDLGGNALMKTQSAYSTAVQVVKPRNLNTVIAKCLEEAAIAGDEFYYAWKQGSEIIEGASVGAALAIARNFGNCAVDCKVEETPTAYVFYGAFIDLETGFNLVRPFRQNKQSPKTKDGRDIYKGERGKDIVFQIGASKGIRNAVLNGVPKWLTSKVMAKAKENVVAKIQGMGLEKARTMIIKKAEALKIPIERIENVYSKMPSWDIEKLVMLSGALRSIENGEESIDTLFPEEKKNETATNKTETVDTSTGEIIPAQPEIESAAVVKEESKENLFDESLTPDMPKYWIESFKQTKTKVEAATFQKKHKNDIDSFTGKAYSEIITAFEKHEQTLKKVTI